MLACSKRDLLDMWLLPVGTASSWLDREMHPRSSFYSVLHIFIASREACQFTIPENLQGKVCISLVWSFGCSICSLSQNYRCYASSGCFNFTHQALHDSQKAISAFNAEQIQIQIRNVALQNRLALFWKLQKEELVPLFIPSAVHICLIWALMLLTLLNRWTKWFRLWILLNP